MLRTMNWKLLAWVFAAAGVGLWACDEDGAATEETAQVEPEAAEETAEAAEAEAQEEEAKQPSPTEVCTAMAAAAKAEDADKVLEHVTEASKAKLEDEAARTAVLGFWGGAECGEASVTEDAATVTLTAGENQREAVFVSADGAWRHDVAAYLEKYPVEEQAKKRKGKKGKKRKARQ